VNARRILLVSNARPSRTSRLARRIMREADAQICGIVQRPVQELPLAQHLLAYGCTMTERTSVSTPRFGLGAMRRRITDAALWWIHGAPNGIVHKESKPNRLYEKCDDIGCPVLIEDDVNGSKALSFVIDQQPDLGIMLGEEMPGEELLKVPRCGWIRASQNVAQPKALEEPSGIAITIESLAGSPASALTIARVTLPRQSYDGLVGQTLKADLIADDLTIQSVTRLLDTGAVEAMTGVAQWTQEILLPYLEQIKPAGTDEECAHVPPRHRPTWKLCLDTLLLCSPLVAGRNWYRRLRRQYPVTILTHHLVSDRPHRMGISTEAFWQQIQFLQKHYRIISLREAVALLKSGRVDAPTVVLTFDDGYADNFVSLRAVAEETGIPVTLFIAADPVEFRQEFAHDLENGIRGALPLTWQQIQYWSSESIEFGSHTRTHFDCGSNDKSRLESEIVQSRRDLEQRLGRPVDFFAFPFGQPQNISAEALRLARQCYGHFLSGFGGDNHCGQRQDDQHLLRKNLYSNAWEQELDLQSVFDLVDRIRKALSPRGLRPAKISTLLSSVFSRPIAEGSSPETQVDVLN
jgi:peptidoglycan/xylan/chitin deacetylase (PgdA/CDA1 family)